MVRSFVEMLLGEWGRQLLYFYEANACLINSIILTYGLMMYLSWNNLVRIYRYLIVGIAKQIHVSDDVGRKTTIKQTLSEVEIPWQEAIDASPFPLVARLGAVIPKKKSVEALKYFFDEKELAEKAHEALKGANIRKMSPVSRAMLQRELELRKAEREAKEEQED